MIHDFRSDTVTRPTPPMMQAMVNASVGDDVYGEDPTVKQLEARIASLLGKDAALFVPSGTMANQLAVHLQTRPGDSIIAEAGAHVAVFEAGAAAALSGVQFDFVPREERLADAAIALAIKPESHSHPTSSLLVIENTHTNGSGRVLDVTDVARIVKAAKAHGLAVHCDGARLWNAAVVLGVKESELVKGVDTVSVCFSKGLGAPAGSALAGPKALIERARKVRKRWGGSMRQSGFLAAAALYAVDEHRGRLSLDHQRARRLALGLEDVLRPSGGEVDYPEIGTNILYFKSAKHSAGTIVAGFKAHGVLVGAADAEWVRAVTHLDLTDASIDAALDAARLIISEY